MTVYSYSLPYVFIVGYTLLVFAHVAAVLLHAARNLTNPKEED